MENIMSRKELIAIKKCGRNKPGEKFRASSSEAKALIALKMAKLYEQNSNLPVYSSVSDEFTIKQSENLETINKLESNLASKSSIVVSDYLRDYATQNNIELSSIVGSGKDGRITKRDIESAIEARSNDQQ